LPGKDLKKGWANAWKMAGKSLGEWLENGWELLYFIDRSATLCTFPMRLFF